MRSIYALIQDHKRLEAENKELKEEIEELKKGPFNHNYGPYKGEDAMSRDMLGLYEAGTITKEKYDEVMFLVDVISPI